MRAIRLLFILVVLTGYFLASLVNAPPIQAANFTQAQIRLSRNKSATPPGSILIVVQTSDVAAEDAFKVSVGNAWTIDSTAGSFTTSTANLPTGVTAWPGIQTATAVTGNDVTFPSSDLTPNTTYGFYITGGIPSNPASGTGWEYAWTLTTLAASTPVSSTIVGVPVVANDQVVITAVIEPPASEFDAQIATVDDLHTLTADEEVEYEITYGSTYTQNTPLTIQAEWTLGTIDGNASPTVDIAEYVLGSATDAYNNTSPVIDQENQTITWVIASYPANTTGQTVRFKLNTASVVNSQSITFEVKARIIDPTDTGYSTVDHTYYYSPVPPSPVPTPTPPATTPSPSTSTTVSTAPSISSVTIRSVTSSSMSVNVITNPATQLILNYGTSPTSLTNSIQATDVLASQLMTIRGLQPGTTYYFQIQTTGNSQETTSDIFTFTTATQAPQVALDDASLIVSSNGIHLATNREVDNPFISIVYGIPHEISFRLTSTETLQSVWLVFDSINVLGTSTQPSSTTASAHQLLAIETSPGVYSVKLNNELPIGNYQVSVRIKDFFGNTSELPLHRLAVVPPMTIVDHQTLRGIHDAQVLLWVYNPFTRLYEQVVPGSLLAFNPVISNAQGHALFSLPPGKYKTEVSAVGYHNQESSFEINLTSPAVYPFIKLERTPFSFSAFIRSRWETIKDFFSHSAEFIRPWTVSSRFFNLMSTVTLSTFAFLSFVAFSLRSQMPFKMFRSYLAIHLALLLGLRTRRGREVINGVVKDDSTRPVGQATLIVTDPSTKQAVAQTTTNHKGYFHIITPVVPVSYRITKTGYQDVVGTFIAEDTVDEVIITVQDPDSRVEVIEKTFLTFFKRTLSFFFEFLIIASLGLEILFTFTHGIWATWPFIVLTLLNLLLWQVYLHSHRFR